MATIFPEPNKMELPLVIEPVAWDGNCRSESCPFWAGLPGESGTTGCRHDAACAQYARDKGIPREAVAVRPFPVGHVHGVADAMCPLLQKRAAGTPLGAIFKPDSYGRLYRVGHVNDQPAAAGGESYLVVGKDGRVVADLTLR